MPQTWLVVQCFQCEAGLEASTGHLPRLSLPRLSCASAADAPGRAPARPAASQPLPPPPPARPLLSTPDSGLAGLLLQATPSKWTRKRRQRGELCCQTGATAQLATGTPACPRHRQRLQPTLALRAPPAGPPAAPLQVAMQAVRREAVPAARLCPQPQRQGLPPCDSAVQHSHGGGGGRRHAAGAGRRLWRCSDRGGRM